MALKIGTARLHVLKAAVTGRLYLTDRWKPNAFVHKDQIIVFIIPAADKRILRLRMAAANVVHLQKE
jgi:hypothetical protein